MQPIIFNSVQDFVLYTIFILGIGTWIGGTLIFKVSKTMISANNAIPFKNK